jgi:chromosome segregation ATPase
MGVEQELRDELNRASADLARVEQQRDHWRRESSEHQERVAELRAARDALRAERDRARTEVTDGQVRELKASLRIRALEAALRNLLDAIDKHQVARTGYGFEYAEGRRALSGAGEDDGDA